MILGTHCIVNSFTAPFLFFGLALCLPCHENKVLPKQRTTARKLSPNMSGEISRKFNVLQKDASMYAVNGAPSMNDALPATRHSAADIKKKSKKSCDYPAECSFMRKKEIYVNGTNSLKKKHEWAKSSYRNRIRHVFGGILIGTICYIRPDTVLYVGIIYTSVSLTYITLLQHLSFISVTNDIFLTFIGAITALIFGVAYDCWRYGILVIPPFNWIKFNILTNRSSTLFGSNDHTEYTKLIFYSNYDEILFVTALLFYSYKYLFGKTKRLIFKLSVPMQVAYILLIICYFSIRHKEARFLHNFIVLYLILISYGFHILVEIASQICVKKSRILIGIILLLLSFCFNTCYNFPSAVDASARKLTYKNAITSKDVNVCLDFISRANDVKGVMIDASIFQSHAFSVLQQDVPLLTKIHNEYRLYKDDSERPFPWRRVRVLSNYADFIDAKNSQYLLRLLGISNSLNYIVTSRVNFYKVIKYHEIFKSGNYSVLLKNLIATEEEALNKMAETLPLGMNATILEYETNWLLTSGLYELAITRAKRSLELDQSRVRVFQQLIVAFAKMEKWSEVKRYETLCFKIHGQSACETKQDKIVLHNEYRQFDIS